MNISNIIASVLTVAKAIAPVIPFGQEGVAVVNAVTGLFNDVTANAELTPEQVEQLEAGRDEFEAAVNAHADEVVSKLVDKG